MDGSWRDYIFQRQVSFELPDPLRLAFVRASRPGALQSSRPLSVGADQFPGLTSQVRNLYFEFLAFGCKATLVFGLSLQLTQLLLLISHLSLQTLDLLFSFPEMLPHVFQLLLGQTRLDVLLGCSCVGHRRTASLIYA